VGARAARADLAAEDAAVVAALLAGAALAACWAFIDGVAAAGSGRGDGDGGGGVLAAAAERGLAAPGGAVGLPAGPGEGLPQTGQ
jgi:hypothetical protein